MLSVITYYTEAKAAPVAAKVVKAQGEPCSAADAIEEAEAENPTPPMEVAPCGRDPTGLGEAYLKERAQKAAAALEHEDSVTCLLEGSAWSVVANKLISTSVTLTRQKPKM